MAEAKGEGAQQTAGLITKDQAARLLMMTTERLRQLIAEGYIKAHDRTRVPLVSAVQGYIGFLKEEDRRSSKSAAESRVRDARAREIEVRTAQREGELVPLALALEIVDEAVGIYRSEIGILPARISANPGERRRIQGMVDDTQRKVAERLAQWAGAARKGAGPQPAEAENPA